MGASGQTQRMDDAMGPGWWLVLAPRVHADVRRLAVSLSASGLRVMQAGTPQRQETEGLLSDWFRRHDCQAAWVRPDRYVYGVAHAAQELRDQWQALSHF